MHPHRHRSMPVCAPESRATRSRAAFRPSSIVGSGDWTATDGRAPTATCRRVISSSRPGTSSSGFDCSSCVRHFNPNADDPLFRPIDADDFRVNGDQASDFRNLRENGLVRIVFPLPPNVRLVDPATNLPSDEATVDVWRSVPSVNERRAERARQHQSVAARPERVRRLSARRARRDAARSRRSARSSITRRCSTRRRQRMLDDLVVVPADAVHAAPASAISRTPSARDRQRFPIPIRRSPPLEQQGKAVFERACTQCHGGPGSNVGAGAGAALPGHSHAVSATGRHRDAGAVRFSAVPRSAGAQCKNLRDRAGRRHHDSSHQLRSGPGAPDRVRRRRRRPPTTGTSSTSRSSAASARTAPYFHNNSAATLDDVIDHYMAFFTQLRVLTAPGAPPPPPTTTDGVHFDRAPLPEERQALLAYLKKL